MLLLSRLRGSKTFAMRRKIMWYDESVFYQIYPLGLCGAPRENDGIPEHRLRRIFDWIPHIEKLGCGAGLFNPLFESGAHG